MVDDGSDAPAEIQSVVKDAARDADIQMRYERLALGGLNGARNHGASVAQGDVLAFLDDDTLVSPGWAAALLRTFEQQPCAAVGGKVQLRLDGPEPAWLSTRRYYLAEYDLGPEPCWLTGELIDGRDPFPVGANCAVRRSDFNALGGFVTGLDRIGKSLVSNGDTEFFRRLHATGRTLRYEPEAGVIHCVPGDRLTVKFFAKRHYAQGYSDQLLLTMGGHAPDWPTRAHLLGKLRQGATRLGKDVLKGRGTVEARFEIDYWAGRLAATGMRPQPGNTNAPSGRVR